MLQISLQNELRDRLGITVGQAKGEGNRLVIECASIADRDRILADTSKLCRSALAMGFTSLLVTVAGTGLRHPFKLETLQSLDQKLRS